MSPNQQPYPPNQQYPNYPAYPSGQTLPAPYFPPYFEPPTTPEGVPVVLPPPSALPALPSAPLTAYTPGQQAPLSPTLQQAPMYPANPTNSMNPASKVRRWPAILLFCFFAGIIPETIVTSSSSPLKMVAQPLTLPLIIIFYGTSDLLIREAMIRRRLGLASLLVFGIAFGFLNEGVTAGTWYYVVPNGYAMYGGIDWLWVLSLTIFHILISVITPIAFFDSLFPRFAGQPLLRRRGMIISLILLAAVTSLIALAPLYRPQRVIVLVITIVLALIALRLPPARQSSPSSRTLPGVWRLRLLGFLAMLTYYFCIYLVPDIFSAILRHARTGVALTQVMSGVILLLATVYAIEVGVDWSQRLGWSARHNLALMTGAVAFTTLLSIPFESNVLEPIATVPFFALLVWLAWRQRHSTAGASGGATPSVVPQP